MTCSSFNESFTAHELPRVLPKLEHVICVIDASRAHGHLKLHDGFQKAMIWRENIKGQAVTFGNYDTGNTCHQQGTQVANDVGEWGMWVAYILKNILSPLFDDIPLAYSLLLPHCSTASAA